MCEYNKKFNHGEGKRACVKTMYLVDTPEGLFFFLKFRISASNQVMASRLHHFFYFFGESRLIVLAIVIPIC
jgi:hypothetical protein